MDALLSRITIDPAICHGKPCVRGLRYPVETLLELLSSGMTFDQILADYEDLIPTGTTGQLGRQQLPPYSTDPLAQAQVRPQPSGMPARLPLAGQLGAQQAPM